MENDKLKNLFDSHYIERFPLLRNLKIIKYYKVIKDKSEFYIQIIYGKGIFKTEVYIIRVIEKSDNEEIKRNDLMKAYHKKELMKKYLKQLINGGSENVTK